MKLFCLLFILQLSLLNCDSTPGYFEDLAKQMETIPFPATDPAAAPDAWLLAHIDVETTGLIPGYHEMIDIGIVMTDLEGVILDSLFLRIAPDHPERLSPGAFEVNAFSPERWEELNAMSISESVDSILAFHKKNSAGRAVLMVAYNCQFDAAFLDHLFRAANQTWRHLYHYYILDLPSMAWGLGLRDLNSAELMNLYSIEDEPHVAEEHTGITGAMVNVRIYRALLRYQHDRVQGGIKNQI